MKKILIISPNFPPVNSADMHRVRQSLPYFREMGWDPTVVATEPEFVEMGQDENLLNTIPDYVPVHRLKALSPLWTRKIGLGNLGLRSLYHLYDWGKKHLKTNKYDLIYFSTTAFPVMTLGRHWKKEYDIPFIIDMQDPWRNDYYLSVPKNQRPPKFKMAYTLDKWMESWTMKKVDGIVSVSDGYPRTLRERYENIPENHCKVIPFGGSQLDFDIIEKLDLTNPLFDEKDKNINLVYIGRGGHDMAFALKGIFGALKIGLEKDYSLYSRIRMYFVGTSYAVDGHGLKTIEPIAEDIGIKDQVIEITDRLPYFQAINILKQADGLIVPGSNDSQYTASKLYPYLLANKPLVAAFHNESSVVKILQETNAGKVVSFSNTTDPETYKVRFFQEFDIMLRNLPFKPQTNWQAFEPYSAKEMTRKQVELFDKIIAA